MADPNLAQLLEAGVHFGHKSYRWNPKMFPYIYRERNNIHILDLVQTAQLLKRANSYVAKAASENKKFLFKLSINSFLSSVGLILQHNPIRPSIGYRFFEFLSKATANNFYLIQSFSSLIFI